MRTYKEEPRKLENSFAEIQTELKSVKTRKNNAEDKLVTWKIE